MEKAHQDLNPRHPGGSPQGQQSRSTPSPNQLQIAEVRNVDGSPSPRGIELLATVAHELRNPIAAIHYALRILGAANQPSSALQQAHAVIDRQLLRLARISEDLLSAGYVATGKLELRKQLVDIRDVVNAAAETCRPQFDEGSHTLIRLLPPDPIAVEADPIRLVQVVTNLLDNAVKYSERNGTVLVSIETSGTDASIRIVDRGIGIAADFLPHVFDLFTQSNQARFHSCRGMGIGLSLVKRIVELHQGVVHVSSPGPGLGSTFTVRLPRNI